MINEYAYQIFMLLIYIGGGFFTVIGLFVFWHILRPQKSPADTSNRINKFRLWWFAMTREELFVDIMPWLKNDELENIVAKPVKLYNMMRYDPALSDRENRSIEPRILSITVSSQHEKIQLLNASRYLRELPGIDPQYMIINKLCDLNAIPDIIHVQPEGNS